MGGGPRRRRMLAIAALTGIVSAPAGWLVSDRLEEDDDFCTSCHVAPSRPLHAALRTGFDAAPAASLAAVHGGATVQRTAAEPPTEFRCIDCHGGASFIGRVRVKALAAKDAFWYAVGHFEEPTHMRSPLWDEDCRKCHDAFDEREVEAWQSPHFHQLPVHNAALGVDCVACHEVHESGGNPDSFFLRAPRVRSQCARCHSEFLEGMG